MANPALFEGEVRAGQRYILVDDFVGQGGTIANLRGYVESERGVVVAATVLTGQTRSAQLSLSPETLGAVRSKHGKVESWWRLEFGYGFEVLTESEARYLLRVEDADTIRARVVEARSQDLGP